MQILAALWGMTNFNNLVNIKDSTEMRKASVNRYDNIFWIDEVEI